MFLYQTASDRNATFGARQDQGSSYEMDSGNLVNYEIRLHPWFFFPQSNRSHSFFRKRCHNDSCLRLRKKAMNLQNTDPECRDMWETASEDSSSDDDCVASICLRLSNRPEDEEEEEEGEEVVVGGTLEI
uniref:uncharacterized protein si:ch211-40k21.5 isoform X2 n=1 Tax=Solea senegalensis TaxID=28829 RepID=UPI001CD8471C|nr:uncharacterized protein si:ch211-40k21.5 isoform X2 [Solea senegalensis]